MNKKNKGYKPRIYVCTSVRSKTKGSDKEMQELKKELENAEKICDLIIEAGGIPLCSSLYCIYALGLNDQVPKERAMGFEIRTDMLQAADEVYVFSDQITEDMAAEINFASKLGIPVRALCQKPGLIGKDHECNTDPDCLPERKTIEVVRKEEK